VTTRRDLFKFAGGAAIGALFTPAPWRLITDTALWSENWPGIPQPASGEIRAKFTHCALCPAGCAVRARCVGDQPVSLAGVRGGLCPFGVTGHHLPYHPARLRHGPVEEAAKAIAQCRPDEKVAVLDLRPGRTASWTYRRALAAKSNGVYLAAPRDGVSYDLAGVKTVLSLGVPVLDGWGAPGTVFAAREHFRLIQAEAVESRTAALADWWLAVRPGSEDLVARAIAGEISVADASAGTGIPLAGVIDELQKNGPALVIGGPAAIAANRALGALGKTAVAQNEAPVPEEWKKTAAPVTELASLPDRSIRVLLIDESAAGGFVEWAQIEKKLVSDHPMVLTVACSRGGYARYAQAALPAAVYPEVTDDFPPAVDSVAPTFRIATPLVKAPQSVANPVELLGGVAGDPLRDRAAAIHKTGIGSVTTYADGKTTAVKDLTADDFWKALNGGACWTGPEERRAPATVETPQVKGDAGLPLLVSVEGLPAGMLISPLMSKVYQESNLRLAPNRVALHPAEARQYGIEDGGRAVLETSRGRVLVAVTVDSSVPPGVVQAGSRSLCGGAARARVVRI
jgi:hypothetical protein